MIPEQTDTSSDSGHEEIDMSDLNGLDHGEASAHAYWQYRLHKRKGAGFQASLLASSDAFIYASELPKGKEKVFPDTP